MKIRRIGRRGCNKRVRYDCDLTGTGKMSVHIEIYKIFFCEIKNYDFKSSINMLDFKILK